MDTTVQYSTVSRGFLNEYEYILTFSLKRYLGVSVALNPDFTQLNAQRLFIYDSVKNI